MTAALISFIHIIPEEYLYIVIMLSVPVIVMILFIQVILSNMKTNVKDVAITFLGICYIVGFILFIPILHGIEDGKFLVWYIIFAAWGTDVFAYYVGINFGKHKLTAVSPNKSVEGSIGGIVRSSCSFFNIYYCYKQLYRYTTFIFIYSGYCSIVKCDWANWRFSSI